MRPLLHCLAVAALLLLVAPPVATALQIANFTASYAPANWQTTAGAGDGTVTVSAGLDSIIVTGANNGTGIGIAVDFVTDFTTTAQGTGVWSFDFTWLNTDTCCFDFGGFLLEGVFTELSPTTSGSRAISVAAGDSIGYRVACSDCVGGPGFLTISNFSAPFDEVVVPSPVSEPSAFLLIAVGLAGLALRGLRRRTR